MSPVRAYSLVRALGLRHTVQVLAPPDDLPMIDHTRALPPGRLPYRQHRPLALLHTIQTVEAYRELCTRGSLIGRRWQPDHDFDHAYGWMLQQFQSRVCPRAEGLIWFWARTTRREVVRDCRHAIGQVLVTCAVDPSRLLLSDFHDWHNVLNRVLNVPKSITETPEQWWARAEPMLDAFDERHDRTRLLDLKPWDEWPRHVRAELEESWMAIFERGAWRRGATIQAVTSELRADEIVRAVRLSDGKATDG